MSKEELVTIKIIKAFSNEKKYYHNFCFKLPNWFMLSWILISKEFDENWHEDRNIDNEMKRQKAIGNKLEVKLVKYRITWLNQPKVN